MSIASVCVTLQDEREMSEGQQHIHVLDTVLELRYYVDLLVHRIVNLGFQVIHHFVDMQYLIFSFYILSLKDLNG